MKNGYKHTNSALAEMVYGHYRYSSHNCSSFEERHAELFITVSIRELSEICSISRKIYTSFRKFASKPSVLFSTNMLDCYRVPPIVGIAF